MRTLTASETRGLSDLHKGYLLAHQSIVSLEPHLPPSQALYLTCRHGAVTIERAMELDAIQDRYLASQASISVMSCPRAADDYSNREDDFIDRCGFSSHLT